jgi:hypothetical protein
VSWAHLRDVIARVPAWARYLARVTEQLAHHEGGAPSTSCSRSMPGRRTPVRDPSGHRTSPSRSTLPPGWFEFFRRPRGRLVP